MRSLQNVLLTMRCRSVSISIEVAVVDAVAGDCKQLKSLGHQCK